MTITISGSEIGIIAHGGNKYRSRQDLYLEKRGLVQREETTNQWAQRGHDLERMCLDMAMRKLGLEAWGVSYQVEIGNEHSTLTEPLLHRHVPVNFNAVGHADALCGHPQVVRIVLEAKCFNTQKVRRIVESGQVPDDIRAQITWYLWLSGTSVGYACFLDYDAWDVHCLRVDYDEQYLRWLVEQAFAFAKDVHDGIAPIDALYDEDTPRLATDYVAEPATPLSELISQLAGVSRQLVQLEDQSDDLKLEIIKAWPTDGTSPYAAVRHYTGRLTLSRPGVRKSIDTTRLRKELPEIAERYTNEVRVSPILRCKWDSNGDDND